MRAFFILVLILTVLNGCSSEDPVGSSDEPSPEESDYLYLDLNKWMYSQMNHSYLWREDLPDSLHCDFYLPPREFFNSLLSKKDRFSYFTTNPYYSKPSEYGFAYQRYKFQNQDDIYQVLYVKNSILKAQGMKRGDVVEIKTLNGNHIYSKLDIVDNAIQFTGTIYTEPFNTRGISNSNTVLLDSVYQINGKKIGYICYLEFDGIDDLAKPLTKMYNSQIDELILDLRYNPGGYVNTCQYLCNCIVPASGYNDIFQKCRYNDIISQDYFLRTGISYTISYFQTPPSVGDNVLGTKIMPLNLKTVYFLTSSHTASASEAAIICLRPYMKVNVIGETTVGKGVGSWTIFDSKYKYAIQPITMRYFNAVDETTPDEGITPDFYVGDGFTTSKKEIGDINEPLLNTAIDLILEQSIFQTPVAKISDLTNDNVLISVGEPSFVTDFRNKQIRDIR